MEFENLKFLCLLTQILWVLSSPLVLKHLRTLFGGRSCLKIIMLAWHYSLGFDTILAKTKFSWLSGFIELSFILMCVWNDAMHGWLLLIITNRVALTIMRYLVQLSKAYHLSCFIFFPFLSVAYSIAGC